MGFEQLGNAVDNHDLIFLFTFIDCINDDIDGARSFMARDVNEEIP